MNKKNAKMLTCILLGAESLGAITAVLVTVVTIAKFLNPQDALKTNEWLFNNGFYLLAGLAAVYGFILRPIRRKAVETFSTIPHFKNWVFYAEVVSIILFIVCEQVDNLGLSLCVLGLYSAWKVFEIFADRLIVIKHNVTIQ